MLKPQIPMPGPKPVLTPPGAAAPVPTAVRVPTPAKAEPVSAETMRITVPDQKPAAEKMTPKPAAPAPTPLEVKTVMAAKKETSRIPLELAAPSKPGISEGKPTEPPKTIRIKPAAAPTAIKIGGPAGGIKPAAPVITATGDEKRKTSRISLEAAFAEEAAKPGEGPKTIKLKRPTEAATIKVGPRPAAAVDGETLSKTARLDLPPAEDIEEGPTPTKRKTIKIKKPGVAGTDEGPAPVTIARAELSAEAAPAAEDETSWVFPALSFVAIIVMVVLIYIILASGLVADMGWIGKVVISR